MSRCSVWILAIVLGSGWGAAFGHKLSPTGTEEQRRLAGISGGWISKLEQFGARIGLKHFNESVHEEITNRIYGCEGGFSQCGGLEGVRAPAAVLAGVRWNDDPPFRLSAAEGKNTVCKVTQTIRFQTQPYCWYQLFSDAAENAASGQFFSDETRSALLYRTHFGDLQPLHAMAARANDPASLTRAQVLDWLQFAWRIGSGEILIDEQVSAQFAGGMQPAFDRSGWSVRDLLTLGSPGLRRHIQDVGFGSFLHVLQDSFAAGHVERELPNGRRCRHGDVAFSAPGLIREFHTYAGQDHGRHAQSDSRAAFLEVIQEEGDVIEIGRELLRARDDGATWADVKPLVECVFDLSSSARAASPGAQYSVLL